MHTAKHQLLMNITRQITVIKSQEKKNPIPERYFLATGERSVRDSWYGLCYIAAIDTSELTTQ